jgi:hypothetical protein
MTRRSAIITLWIILLSSSGLSQSATEPQRPVVVESAFNVERSTFRTDTVKVWWIIILKNPNTDYYYYRPHITITARDTNGEVLGNKEKDFPAIPPGGTIAYGDDLEVIAEPAKLDYVVSKSGGRPTGTKPLDYRPFAPARVKVVKESYKTKVLGEVFNPYNKDIDALFGTVLFRDKAGKLIGGDTFYIKEVPAKGTKPFADDLWAGSVPANFATFDFLVFPTGLVDWEELVRSR